MASAAEFLILITLKFRTHRANGYQVGQQGVNLILLVHENGSLRLDDSQHSFWHSMVPNCLQGMYEDRGGSLMGGHLLKSGVRPEGLRAAPWWSMQRVP